MQTTAAAALTLTLLAPVDARAEAAFKLGTFAREGRTLLGIVLADLRVVDIAAANVDLQKRHPDWKRVAVPKDMTELIEHYEDGLRERLHAIAREAGAATSRPRYVHELKTLQVRPP